MIDLQIAVAKAMGWKQDGKNHPWISPSGDVHGFPPRLTLDLMWQAEEMLRESEGLEWQKYLDHLYKLCVMPSEVVHATVEQRARAWLKVKGVEL